jgi:hypothetical protein
MNSRGRRGKHYGDRTGGGRDVAWWNRCNGFNASMVIRDKNGDAVPWPTTAMCVVSTWTSLHCCCIIVCWCLYLQLVCSLLFLFRKYSTSIAGPALLISILYCTVVTVSKRHDMKLFICLIKKKKLMKSNFLYLIQTDKLKTERKTLYVSSNKIPKSSTHWVRGIARSREHSQFFRQNTLLRSNKQNRNKKWDNRTGHPLRISRNFRSNRSTRRTTDKYKADRRGGRAEARQTRGRTCPQGELHATSRSKQYTPHLTSATVEALYVYMWGAGGGDAGGNGAYVEGRLPVTAGQYLTVIVGQAGIYYDYSHAFGGGRRAPALMRACSDA